MERSAFKAIEQEQHGTIEKCFSASNVNQVNEEGYTPLYYACMKKKVGLSTVKTILRLGADVNLKGRDSETPLYISCFNGKTDTALLLLDNGADVNAANGPGGETALHVVSRTNDCALMGILLSRGADVNALNVRKETPLYVAAKDGHHLAVYHLLKAGADKNLNDVDGKDPLYIASERNLRHVVIILKSDLSGLDVARARADEELRLRPPPIKSTEAIMEEAKSSGVLATHLERPAPIKELEKPMEIVEIVIPRPKGRDPLAVVSDGPCRTLEEVGYDEAPAIPQSLSNRPPAKPPRIGGTSMRVGTSIDVTGIEPVRIDNMIGDSVEFFVPSIRKH